MEKRKNRILSEACIRAFHDYLIREEKSTATVEKYLRDVRAFLNFAGHKIITKELVMDYKQSLLDKKYAVSSINSMLASINSMLTFFEWGDCKVKSLKIQRQIYCTEEKELTKVEYMRLLEASKNNPKLNLVIQTICSTGIRISELKYFTVEAVKCEEITVRCKGKIRTILIPRKLKKMLLTYAKKNRIKYGMIFITKFGTPLDRSNIWAQMKKLCEKARVKSGKVFPHNLRKLFARTFYSIEKDIAKLADILGHSNINTTRIYIISTGTEHRKKIERLGLVV